ncbi:MAG: ATP synthase F1 subunit delta [Nitrospinae bacterium]|nr:ATP synthase F1 subunit delta [Nitrospinota bacterium]
MRDKKAAARYSIAALDSIRDQKEMETVGRELDAFSEAYSENAELRKILSHPGVPGDRKKNVLRSVAAKLAMGAKSLKVVEVVLGRGRIELIADISEIYALLLDEKLGRQKVRVSSAYPLNGSETAELEKLFSSISGKKAVLEVGVEKSLIGGVVARVGSTVYDGSVVNQLAKLRLNTEV